MLTHIFQEGLETTKIWPTIERASREISQWAADLHYKQEIVAHWSTAKWPVKYKDGWPEDPSVILMFSMPEFGKNAFVAGCYETLSQSAMSMAWGDALHLLNKHQLDRVVDANS